MILKFSPMQKDSLSRLFDCAFELIPPAALLDLTTAEWVVRNRVGRKGLGELEMMMVAVMGGHLSLPADVRPEDPKPENYETCLTPEMIAAAAESAPKKKQKQTAETAA